MRLNRQIDILNYLRKHRAARITELTQIFGVSKNTIRRDLANLESQGAAHVTHGGAILADKPLMGLPLGEREVHLIDEKRRIGRQAVELIADGMAVLLDAGTTTEQIASSISGLSDLTVITNGLNVLFRLSYVAGITVVSAAGLLNPVTNCFAGFHAEQFLGQFHVDIAFISAGGITENGVTNTNTAEVQIKRTMIRIADKVVLVVAHDKIGKVALAPFAVLDELDVIITDEGADLDALNRLRKAGAKVTVC